MMLALRETYFWLVGNPAALLVLAVGGVAALSLLLRLTERWLTVLRRVAAAMSVAVFLAVVASYYSSPAFIDHVEPQIAAVGWLHHTGQPLYHPLDGRQVYSGGPYGAGSILLVSAGYALFGPSLLAAKAASAFALLLAVLLGAHFLWREDRGRWPGGMVAFLALLALPFGAAFWLRADPAILAVATIGTGLAWCAGRVLAMLGAALCLGAICWLKVHGAFYLFPGFIVLLARFGPGPFLFAGVTGAILGAAQFLPWTGHGENFAAVLRLYSGNAILPDRISPMLQWTVVFTAPFWSALIAPGAWRTIRSEALLRWTLPATVLAMLTVAVLAARPGLGYWHLLPFAPVIALLAARIRRIAPLRARLGNIIWTGWWLAVALLVFTRHDDVIVQLHRGTVHGELREIDRVRANYRDHIVLMGLGEELHRPSYRRTFQRAYLALTGNPYPYDLVVMMDYRYLGLSESLASPPGLLPVGKPAVVLIPAGEIPWAARSIFGGDSVSADFRRRFDAHYRIEQRGEHYDVWVHTPPVNSTP